MSSSSMLLARTSQRLKQLITSQSNSKKSSNHDPSPTSNPASPPTPRRTSRPHSWILHTSTRKCDASYSEHSPTLTVEATPTSPSPRIEPPAIPKTAKGRTRSDGNVARPGNGDGHGILFSRSESSLCCASTPECGGSRACAQGCEESDCSTPDAQHSLSGRDASDQINCTPTSCRDAACRLPVPRKSSRRKKPQTTPSLDLFSLPPSRRPPQLSTLNIFEALKLDPDEGLRTPTQPGHEDIKEAEDSTEDYSLPLSRTGWSDDVEQLIRETDKAFKAVSFALSDAKEATNGFRPINWRPDINTETQRGPESPRKESMRMRGKQAVRTPLTRNASIKTTKPKRKKSTKNRKMALQAFPNTSQNQSPRWTLPEVTAELFGGRMFGRLEADEMLKSEESIKQARWSRESFMNEKMEEERTRESRHSQSTLDSMDTRDEDRSTPVEPLSLEELSLRLSKVEVEEENTDFLTPRPSPKPPVPSKDAAYGPKEYFDPRLSSSRVTHSHVLPPIPPCSSISPPTPGTLAIFNATAPLPSVSAISQPSTTFHDNGTAEQDPFRYGRLTFPAPPLASKPAQPIPIPQPTPRRSSRSRSVTRTSLATIHEASSIDINPHTLSQSVPATPAKNRSPIRSPPSSGTISPLSSGQGTPALAANSNGRGGSTLLHSALHRGFKRRSKTMPIPQTTNAGIANTEAVSGSLPPRKVTPFADASNASDIIKTTTLISNGLKSTPFSLTAPLFRHGSIRLNSSKHSKSFPNSGNSTGFATPHSTTDGSDGLEAQVIPFDWTAFQMAISGGAGDYLMSGAGIDKKEMEKHEEELAQEREDIYDWWRGFGFRGRDGGMGRVAHSEPRKPQKKGAKPTKHTKGEEEKKRRKTKTAELLVAELPADSLERPKSVPRPWSFQLGQEVLISSDKETGSGGEADVPANVRDAEYESGESDGPDSPMEELSEQELMAGRDVLMGRNLDHDLRGFLRWESMNTRYTVSRHELAPHPHVDRMHTI